MANVTKKTEEKKEIAKEAAAVVPLRTGIHALPRWIERLDELFSERWPPFLPLLRFAEETTPTLPLVDVYEEEGAVVVKAELPGMKKEEIEVHVAGNEVTVSGHKEKEEKVERNEYVRIERSSGAFRRTLRLPVDVELSKVTAAYKDGVLEIRAPKATSDKVTSRKVEVG